MRIPISGNDRLATCLEEGAVLRSPQLVSTD